MNRRPTLGIDTIIMLILFGFFAGIILTISIVEAKRPDCPTEDSCTVDYRDGEWYIEEVTP